MKTTKRILSLLLICAMLLTCTSCGIIDTITGESQHEEQLKACCEEAEKVANSDVYKQLGILPGNLTSEVIYEDEEDLLVGVRYAIDDSTDWAGAYVMYVRLNGTVLNYTDMLPQGYDFEDNLNELKALFGL